MALVYTVFATSYYISYFQKCGENYEKVTKVLENSDKVAQLSGCPSVDTRWYQLKALRFTKIIHCLWPFFAAFIKEPWSFFSLLNIKSSAFGYFCAVFSQFPFSPSKLGHKWQFQFKRKKMWEVGVPWSWQNIVSLGVFTIMSCFCWLL